MIPNAIYHHYHYNSNTLSSTFYRHVLLQTSRAVWMPPHAALPYAIVVAWHGVLYRHVWPGEQQFRCYLHCTFSLALGRGALAKAAMNLVIFQMVKIWAGGMVHGGSVMAGRSFTSLLLRTRQAIFRPGVALWWFRWCCGVFRRLSTTLQVGSDLSASLSA